MHNGNAMSYYTNNLHILIVVHIHFLLAGPSSQGMPVYSLW